MVDQTVNRVHAQRAILAERAAALLVDSAVSRAADRIAEAFARGTE